MLVVATIAYYHYAFPVGTVAISRGTAGLFQIGETKESLLSRLRDEIYSLRPKPSQCPKNWIEVSKATDIENGMSSIFQYVGRGYSFDQEPLP